jgi:hypothetical protein
MNPTKISWTPPTQNVDGTPIVPGEITGYLIGIRSTTGVQYQYPYSTTVPADVTNVPLASIQPPLPPGTYVATVLTSDAAGNSTWATESAPFTISEAVASPPTGVTVS